MVGMLDIKGQDQCRRVYSVNGIAPTLIDDLSKNRIEELRVIRENREAENAILSKLLIPPLCGDESRAEETESEGTQHDADGSSTEDKRTE